MLDTPPPNMVEQDCREPSSITNRRPMPPTISTPFQCRFTKRTVRLDSWAVFLTAVAVASAVFPAWAVLPAARYAAAAAVQRDLDADGGIVAVIEVAKAFKDAPLVLRPRQAVIHILKGNGLRECAALQPAQTVREHILKRDAVLHRMGFSVALCLLDHRLDLLALGTGELTLCRFFCLFSQSASPPVPVGIAAPGRNRDFWSGRCAPSGE